MRYEHNAGCVAEMALENSFQVKDLRNHSAETVDALRGLLAVGAEARPDSKRPHFYEIEDETCVFYVYVSPVTGSVELLATWPRVPAAAEPVLCH